MKYMVASRVSTAVTRARTCASELVHGSPLSRDLRRINDSGLEGVTTRLALPKMADAGVIEVLRPFRQKQLVAALGAFGHRAGYRRAAGIKTHGTFLTLFLRALIRDVFC
jgi:hypothetical protein